MKKLSDEELATARRDRKRAAASLACEGLVLTSEQEKMFREFERERLPHEERRRRIIARYATGKASVDAAE